MIILKFARTKSGKRCTHFGYLHIHWRIIVYTLILALNNFHSEPEAKHFSDEDGDIEVLHVDTDLQDADYMTKGLPHQPRLVIVDHSQQFLFVN